MHKIAQGMGIRSPNRLASIFGVPVAGGLKTQRVGGNLTFAFEGLVVTPVPLVGTSKAGPK